MEGKRLFIGVIIIGFFGCLCNAQWGTQASITNRPWFTRTSATTRSTIGKPTIGKPTLGRPGFTQAPLTPRPTPQPTLGGPKTSVEVPTPKPDSLRAYCGESSVQIEVDLDLFGIGHLIQQDDITLGGCGPLAVDKARHVLQFESELHECGSVLAMSGESLVYTFTFHHQPSAIGGTPIIRTSNAVVGVQCHYMRLYNVSSNALRPTWIPYSSVMTAEDLITFSLRIMTDDWQLERASNVFFLGDLINIEASVIQANHVPLRVFVESCVATLVPDANASPRYPFIENKGCLVDSKLTNSRSQFLQRVQEDKLQFQLDAFRFAQETRSAIYIFCLLKATVASPDSEGKACSFPIGRQRWIEAAGNDQACSCCDSSCTGKGVKMRRSVDTATQYENHAVLGPIIVQDLPESHSPLVDDHTEGASDAVLVAGVMAAEGASGAVLVAGVMAAVGLICIVVFGMVLLKR